MQLAEEPKMTEEATIPFQSCWGNALIALSTLGNTRIAILE